MTSSRISVGLQFLAQPALSGRARLARLCISALLCAAVPMLAAAQPPEQNAPGEAAKEPVQKRFFEEEPYDEIIFKDGNVVAVRPLTRPLPEKPKPTDKLVVRLVSDPNMPLETLWREIERIRLFEQIVLDEARKLVALQKFDEAYEFFQFLTRYHPRLEGLDAALQEYLLAEAQWWQQRGRHDQALALLNDLYRKNANAEGLEAALTSSVDKLVTGYLGKENYAAARQLLAQAQAKFPQSVALMASRDKLVKQAEAILQQAQEAYQQGNLNDARELAYGSARIWPLPAAKSLLEEAQNKSPLVVVGVTMPAHRVGPQYLDDWAARRASRLLHRALLEYVGPGPQGGEYHSPLGELERQGLGRRLVFNLNPSVHWSGTGEAFTGQSVARHLLAMAQRGHPAYQPTWAELFEGVQVRDVYEVAVDLKRAHVHPDRLLETALVPWETFRLGEEPEHLPTTGPYVVHALEGNNVRYRLNSHYFATGARQPREILERHFDSGRPAAAALRIGQIAILDRVNPWEVEGLRSAPNLVVEAYGAPTVHVLIPSGNHPLLTQRLYRRAILSGINRAAILDQLLGGPLTLGNQVVSGPFPIGRGTEDPLGYAYNHQVLPRPYQPRLALTLAAIAEKVDAEQRSKRKETPLEKFPPLTLAHPAHDVARVACRAIQRQLKLVGITVELKELPAVPAFGEQTGFDLRYAELSLWEPVVDAAWLFGPQGAAPFASPYTRLAVQQLGTLNDWRRARQKLQEIHALAADDLSVIPLWQLTEHFAYHKSLQGVAKNPVALYEGVEQWESPPAIVEDSP